MFTDKLDECWYVRLPVLGKTFKVLENCVHSDLLEQGYCVLGVLVEICIEYPLIHEVSVFSNVKQNPSQIVQLESFKGIRHVPNRCLDGLAVGTDRAFSSRLDFGNDGKAITGWGSWIYRAVASILQLKVSLFRNCNCGWLRPVMLGTCGFGGCCSGC